MTNKIAFPKYEHQIKRYNSNNHTLLRNFTVTQFSKFPSRLNVDGRNQISYFKENKIISERFSVIQRNISPTIDSKSNLALHKQRMSNCQAFQKTKYPQMNALKQENSAGQKKVPKFIIQRQLMRSEQTHKKAKSYFYTQSEARINFKKFQEQNNLKTLDKTWLDEMKQDSSFQFKQPQPFSWLKKRQKLICKIEQSTKAQKNVGEFSNKVFIQKNDFKSTQTSINTIEEGKCAQNFFISNLSKVEQQQLRDDFKLLFSSRRLQNEEELEQQNEKLKEQLMELFE